jgi:methionyl-tRNA synthetase
MVVRYREAWKALEIGNDDFIRTTDERHHRGALEMWRRMEAAGDIYKGSYKGLYCVGCETFYPESQLADGKCPTHGTVPDVVEEESYFFRLSKYQAPLLAFFREHPEFVTPRSRMNEVTSFVEMGLEDISISRRIAWGIPVVGDDAHVLYVWLDALSNYVSALGFGKDSDPKAFSPFWPADLHVIGKDILRFHAVFWPAFLMSAGLALPRQILCHGWWLKDDAKMSKSTGNVADPLKLVSWFGADAVRYFLLREIPLGSDGNYSEEAILDRVNSDLANDLGNTLSRITKIVATNLEGRVPSGRAGGILQAAAETAWPAWCEAMDRHDVRGGLEATWELLSATNKFLMAEEPWYLVKDPAKQGRLAEVMHDGAEALRHVAIMVAPVMPTASREMFRRLGAGGDPFSGLPWDRAARELKWGFPSQANVVHDAGMFPRMDKATFFAGVTKDAEGRTAPEKIREEGAQVAARVGAAMVGAGSAHGRAGAGIVQYEDFAKLSFMAARVKAAKRHPNADKLLVLELEDGDDKPRTICAGIAGWYAPEDLVGKTVVIVANLAPRKLRGIESQGMVLAGSYFVDGAEQVRVVELPADVPPGSEVK